MQKEEFMKTLAQLSATELLDIYKQATDKYEKTSVFAAAEKQTDDEITEAFKKHKVRR
jgi:vacuolar-type H+-ATPase subunit C/Vma6